MKRKNLKIFTLIGFILVSLSVFGQRHPMRGSVVDENGEPLVGVTIKILKTNIGTISDLSGSYKLNVAKGETLVFSFVGYETKEIEAMPGQFKIVKLQPESELLDEVVVVGYGTMKKSDLTGSVSSVSSEMLNKSGNANFASSLSGKVSGVQVIQNSGVPGGGVSMRIRGSNSMGNSEPLYIIDGVLYDNSNVSGFESDGASISALSMINPSDIESMEVLKDASATAVYGSRASNGVVIITTKSGKQGKPKVSIDFDYSISELYNRIPLLNSNEYYIVQDEARINAKMDPLPQETMDKALAGEFITYDWQDLLFKKGFSYNTNASISGGTEKVKYMGSLNYYDAEGIVPKTDFSRITGRLNLDVDVTKRVKIGFRLNFSRVSTSGLPTSTNMLGGNNGTNSVISRALRVRPTVSPDGAGTYDPNSGKDNGIEDYSPLMAINGVTQKNTSLQLMPSMYVSYKIINGLELKSTLNYNARYDGARYYQSREMPYGYSEGGWARVKDSNIYSLTNENTLSYNKQITKAHRLNTVIGMSIQKSGNEWVQTSAKGFPNDKLKWHNLSSATNREPTTNGESETAMVSWFGRFNYSLFDRYLFTFTGRVDGSSNFSENNKYGFFPSGAFAWRVNQEKWMKGFKNLSNLKLRLSYGLTGNQAISPYNSLNILNSQSVVFGGSDGNKDKLIGYTYINRLPNLNLKWETTGQLDLGIDLGLFNNRLEIVADYYRKDTRDLLVTAEAPMFTGYANSLLNFGRMRNTGFEIAINGTPFDKKNFSWNTGFNISFNKTILTELEKDYFDSGMSLPWNGFSTQILIEGEKLGTFWGYKRDGIRQLDEPAPNYTVYNKIVEEGDQKYLDLNNDDIINSDDKTIIGCAQPDLLFGFNNTFSFHNFDLSIYIDGSYGNDICNVNSIYGLSFGQDQQFKEVLNRWTPENPTNKYPRLSANNNSSNFMFSDRYIEDGSFIRLQNVTLGYSFPKKWISKIGLTNLRLSFSATNLLTITGYSSYSPDISMGGQNNLMMGHDNGGYPNPTSYKLGINLGF